MQAIVKKGQTLFDIAIQHCGAIEAAFAIARMNDISVTSDLEPNKALQLPEVVNKRVVKFLQDNGHEPATAKPEFNNAF